MIPTTKTIFAAQAAVPAKPPKPRAAAINAMIRKIMPQRNISFSFIPYFHFASLKGGAPLRAGLTVKHLPFDTLSPDRMPGTKNFLLNKGSRKIKVLELLTRYFSEIRQILSVPNIQRATQILLCVIQKMRRPPVRRRLVLQVLYFRSCTSGRAEYRYGATFRSFLTLFTPSTVFATLSARSD